MTLSTNTPLYEQDVVAWLENQAQPGRRGEVEALDLENIAEELEGMARSDRREIRNRLTVLLIDLLKYMLPPKRRSRSWMATIGEERRRIASIINDSPSLRFFPAAIVSECYSETRIGAADETGLPKGSFAESCPFELDAVLAFRLRARSCIRPRAVTV